MQLDEPNKADIQTDLPKEPAPIHSPPRRGLSGMAAALIAAFPGMLFLFIALGFDPLVHSYFDTDPQFIDYSNTRILYFTLFFLAWAVVSLGGGILVGRTRLGAWLARRPLVLSGLFSLHLAFVLLVTADGALGVRGCTPSIPRITYNHTQYFYRCEPAFDRLAWGNDLTYDVFDRAITPADLPREGQKRIIFMGDSVVYGDRIKAGESIPWELTLHLGPEYEVINAGMLGYGFHNYYYYAYDLVKLKPDMVILGICLNDLALSTDRRLTGDPNDPNCGIQAVTWYNQIRWWFNQHSGLLNIDEAFREHHFPKNNYEIERWIVKMVTMLLDSPNDMQHHIRQSRPYIREMAALMRAHDIPFVVVVFPFRFQYEPIMKTAFPNHLELQSTVVDLCEENGIPVLDVYEPMGEVIEKADHRLNLLFLDYNHFTPYGSKKVADIMMPWLQDHLAKLDKGTGQ